MVQALVELDDNTNRALNVVKARHGLKDKAAAIRHVVARYIEEPELRPEFIAKIREIEKRGKFIQVDDFAARYGLKHVPLTRRRRSR